MRLYITFNGGADSVRPVSIGDVAHFTKSLVNVLYPQWASLHQRRETRQRTSRSGDKRRWKFPHRFFTKLKDVINEDFYYLIE